MGESPKRRVTFEFDPSELFDRLAEVGDGGAALGSRLVGCLLAPPGVMTQIGMGFYGIALLTNGADRPHGTEEHT